MTLYETLAERLRAQQPVALATIVDGPAVGRKLLVTLNAIIRDNRAWANAHI